MIEISKHGSWVMLKMPSSQNKVGVVITEFSDFLAKQGVSEYSIRRAIIVLRELLINAISHGNRYNKTSPVTIKIDQPHANQVKISVKDLGCGFDYHSLETALTDNPRLVQARGYRLVKAFTDSCEFNQEGNEVTATISII